MVSIDRGPWVERDRTDCVDPCEEPAPVGATESTVPKPDNVPVFPWNCLFSS